LLDDERARVQEDRHVALSVRNSLTVVLPLRDAAACRVAIERQRLAIERGWAKVPGLISACLATLPGDQRSDAASPALFVECTFESELADLMSALFSVIGAELSSVLAHCAEYPELADARGFAGYLAERARRSSAFASGSLPRGMLDLNGIVWRLLDTFALPNAGSLIETSEEELEARRSAVGMQEPIQGVPLVHVAWLLPRAIARTKRALRDLGRVSEPVEHDARFVLDGTRLLFVAYPSSPAQCWAERLSQRGFGPCARIWRNARGFSLPFGVRRARRARWLAEFVLEQRVPVAAWFNARALRSGAACEG